MSRKIVMLWSGLGTLTLGLGVAVWAPQGGVAFPAFATAVTACVSAAILGNVGEHVAKKGAQ
jgi:hypothetical protein